MPDMAWLWRRSRILRAGPAMRVIFYYPGEEGTFLDRVHVTLYENGILHVRGKHEETTTHIQNCEIVWEYQTESSSPTDERSGKVRLLKSKSIEPLNHSE